MILQTQDAYHCSMMYCATWCHWSWTCKNPKTILGVYKTVVPGKTFIHRSYNLLIYSYLEYLNELVKLQKACECVIHHEP
jgi:hypothetical protein